MKLNKKYCRLLDADEGYDNQELANSCERIADNFALDFSKYVLSQIYNMTHGDKAGLSMEELLIIYKKLK
jgi:hypothetical protein